MQQKDKPFCSNQYIRPPFAILQMSRRQEIKDPYTPSKLYTDNSVPGYLPDTPNIRKELARQHVR